MGFPSRCHHAERRQDVNDYLDFPSTLASVLLQEDERAWPPEVQDAIYKHADQNPDEREQRRRARSKEYKKRMSERPRRKRS